MNIKLEEFQEIIGYKFNNKSLLKQALVHSSYANEKGIGKKGSNERLEFLGDAVLELVSSEFLYAKYKDKSEGELSKLRASFVCEAALNLCSKQIRLGEFVLLGKGEETMSLSCLERVRKQPEEEKDRALYLTVLKHL